MPVQTCDNCGEETRVIDSRHGEHFIRRRRECMACKVRFSTVEITEKEYNRLTRDSDFVKSVKEFFKGL